MKRRMTRAEANEAARLILARGETLSINPWIVNDVLGLMGFKVPSHAVILADRVTLSTQANLAKWILCRATAVLTEYGVPVTSAYGPIKN